MKKMQFALDESLQIFSSGVKTFIKKNNNSGYCYLMLSCTHCINSAFRWSFAYASIISCFPCDI